MLDKGKRPIGRGSARLKKGEMRHPGRGYGRVIDVLELLAAEPNGLTGSEIHRSLKLPKSTSFLILQNLLDRGVLALDPLERRYVVGPVLIQIAHQVAGGRGLVRIARPHLETLSRETTEDVYLGVRSGTQIMYLDRVEGTRSVGFDVRLGWPRHMHSTSTGKLLLAFNPPELLDQVVAEHGLPMLTASTSTNVEKLRKELVAIRARGYAVADGENVDGVYGLAAPIRNQSKQVVGAVHVSTLRARSANEKKTLLQQMLKAAARVSSALGYEGKS